MYFNLRLFAMTDGYRSRILLAATIGLLATGAGIARLALFGVIIAQVFLGASFPSLVAPLLAVASLIVLRGGLQYIRDVVSDRTANDVKVDLRRRLYEHSLALGPGHFDQRRTGDVLTSLVDGVESLETFFGQYLPQLFVAAVAPILIFVFMAVLDVQIGLIFLGFAVFTLLIPSFLQRWNRGRNLLRREAYGALGADFLDSVQGLATLKAFGQSVRRGELLARRGRDLFRRTMGVLFADGASGAATVLGISAGATVALVWGGMRVSSGDLELRTLLIVLMLGAEVFRPLRELTQLYHQGMVAMSAAEGIFALLDEPVTIRDPGMGSAGAGEDVDIQLGALAPEITFEGVSFAYEGGRRSALQDLSFTLNAGETLGLVGPSGAGKSTVLWLMLRFYDPQRGRVLLDGHDLRELPLEALRRQVSVVTQDTYLFQGTVADNLRLGKPDATQQELETAARAASAHDFVVALPSGYDTQIGERGVRLSGGERQRIAIARALLKAAPILVLDEALSSVDAENEAAIQRALDKLMKGKTTIVIAHRLSSVAGADRILVLDKGRMVENGPHAELAAAGGVYAQLMANQQARPEQDLLVATLPSTSTDGAAPDIDREKESPATAEARQEPAISQTSRPLSQWAIWTRLLGLVRRWWGELGLSMLLGITYHVSTIAVGAISALLVVAVFKGGETGLHLILLGIFVPLTAFSRWGESWASHDLAFRLLAEMRIDVYNKLEPLAPAYLVRRRSGDLMSIVTGDVETVEYFFAHVITPVFVAVLVPFGVLITLALVAWPLALVLAPFLLLAAISPFFAQQRSERLGEEMRSQLGDLNAHMVDGIQGMREIVAFGGGRGRVEETVTKGWAFARHRVRFLQAQASHAALIETIAALGGLSVMVAGVWLVVGDQMPRTQLPLVTLLALSTFGPIAELTRTLKQLMETLAASRRIFEVHDEPVAVRDGPGVMPASQDGLLGSSSISFQQVSFSYGPREPSALQDVTFTTGPGQTVALVGRSGAGKTTSAHMLMRFWDPDSGSIELGGHNLRDFKLDELRRHIALVSQDTFLFNTTIRENLRMARQDATDAEIDEAARLANASEFIEAFPDGYDTLVGERGMRLSGGQRQRISIARAILKDAPVLVLDEATSHLDAVNEQQVREALRRLMSGRTTLVIAHRLSTVRDADRIVVLDAGRRVEEGTHQQLLETGGLYAQLVSTQLLGTASEPPDSLAD
jgi:ATP-binding cassette subfamily C protein CydCD